jgi:hypothetical protein
MSEQAPEAPGRAGGGNMLTRKFGGVPAWGWIAAVAGVVGIYFYVKSRKASASSATTAQSSPASATCYDAQGNPVDCSSPQAVGDNSTDEFEALYTQNTGISNELQTITPQISETGTDVDQIQTQLANLQGPGSTTPPGTQPNIGKPGPVTDLTVDVLSPTLARVSWRPPQFASHAPTSTTYQIQIQGKDPAPHNIGSRTSYNVGALNAGSHYTAVVSATGGPSTSKAFTTPRAATRVTTPKKKAA